MAIVPVALQSLNQACTLLRQGDVVGMPTETVYGLAGDAYQDQAIAKIYQIKGRPQFNPLIIHYSDVSSLGQDVDLNDRAEKLAERFWPGPLTLVLPKRESSNISLLATAGLSTLAVRLPAHPLAQQLIKEYGHPLAAPSANVSNTISPTSALDVAQSLKERVPLILDGGACHVGLESTIIDLTGDTPVLLRPGGITLEEIQTVLGEVVIRPTGQTIKAPGMLKRHYAPSIPVRLNAHEPHTGEVYLGFGDTDHGPYNLSRSGDLLEAAANLFRMMRLLDQSQYQGMAIAPIPQHGLGLAINDRLSRAASQEDRE
jgi:L-threonylcarbamoyladenylate synthase